MVAQIGSGRGWLSRLRAVSGPASCNRWPWRSHLRSRCWSGFGTAVCAVSNSFASSSLPSINRLAMTASSTSESLLANTLRCSGINQRDRGCNHRGKWMALRWHQFEIAHPTSTPCGKSLDVAGTIQTPSAPVVVERTLAGLLLGLGGGHGPSCGRRGNGHDAERNGSVGVSGCECWTRQR